MKTILKISFLIILLFGYNFSFSQDEIPDKKGLALGVTFAPQLYNWRISDSEWQWAYDLFDSLYNEEVGFLVEVNLEFELSNKFSIKTGFGSSIARNKSMIMDLNVTDPIIPSQHISMREISYFLELPVMLRYDLYKTDRWRVFLGAGIINKFLFYNVVKSYAEYPETGETEFWMKDGSFVNNFYMLMAASVEAGIAYNFSSRISAAFFPSFEYSFVDISSRKQNSNRGYTLFGLNLSVVYNLR